MCDAVTVFRRQRMRRVRPAGLGAFVAVFAGATPGEPVVVRSQVNGGTTSSSIK